ncbi:uncharacterized protein LOC121600925 [Anopheles merus]|uniref:uncharacterized protein LOC121600925 n=1 Tax=Anopheles merus TaxID=30066 RepID=UPI001BE40E37|nr:uncharacterized protein LOC121600925 [Anopheles merus]
MEINQLLPTLAAEVATLMLILIEEEDEELQQEENARHCWMTDLFLERESDWTRLFRAIDGEGPNNRLESFLRVNREEFYYLLNRIGPKIERQDTTMRPSICPKQRLCIGLRFLASGDSYESLAFLFRVSSSSVSLILPSTATEWLKISKGFEEQWNFICMIMHRGVVP